jgi:hypothetical protein
MSRAKFRKMNHLDPLASPLNKILHGASMASFSARDYN